VDLLGSTTTLRRLNVAAVGLALAACTVACLTQVMQLPGMATGPSTLLAGMAWAHVMRSKKRIGSTTVRSGWVWSVPIAMANAAVSCALYLAMDDGPFWMGLVFGPTLGVLVWGPALVLTLAVFGIPIAWSQQLADKGLAGEERGEAVVGVICAALGLLGLILALRVPGAPEWWNQERLIERDQGLLFARVAGGLALALGLASSALAVRRDAKRREFVAKVHAGNVAGFRVDDTAAGRVLVRVTELGEGYRVTNFTEELYELDEGGDVTHARAYRGARSGS
jgi:hypothetical protein